MLYVPGLDTEQLYHILGDSAYPTIKQLMSAYQHHRQGITYAQKKYNQHLSSKRQVKFYLVLKTSNSTNVELFFKQH